MRTTLLAVAAATLTAGLTTGAGFTASSVTTLKVGTLTLTRCGNHPLTYCGSLAQPLDHADPSGPRITIHYRWYPATSGHAIGTVMPNEGGPGYPTIESVGGYRAMYGPLLKTRNLLAVDLRGTGTSAALSCPALQNFPGPTGTNTTAFQNVLSRCANKLNNTWKGVHASDLFTSAAAAEDQAAIVRALGIGKVDVYGDSYGSFYAQVFAARYPRLTRSVILDSTSPVQQVDPWYRDSHSPMPSIFDKICSRALACSAAAAGDQSWSRISAAARLLRAHPISGKVPGPNGKRIRITMNVVGLVDLVNDGSQDPEVDRELDASVRALLTEHDSVPLLRLYAMRLASDEQYFHLRARDYSGELYFAVACLDYPQLFDMHASRQVRVRDLAAAQARLKPGTFAPFTTNEWLSQDENTEAYTACVAWPAPRHAQPPIAGRPPFFPRNMPVLIEGGEFDTWAPAGGIPEVLRQIGGHARFINFANTTHAVGTGDVTGCGPQIIREFIGNPGNVDHIDASCAGKEPPIHAVGAYPDSLSGMPALTPGKGSTHNAGSLRLAAAAVETAGDALARIYTITGAYDAGLHGGDAIQQNNGDIVLRNDQLIPGVRVSGRVHTAGNTATARLAATGPGTGRAVLTVTWPLQGARALASVNGTVGTSAVSGTTPAP